MRLHRAVALMPGCRFMSSVSSKPSSRPHCGTRRAWTCPAMVILLLFELATRAEGQVIRGSVSEDGSGSAVIGAELSLVDSLDAVLARAITDDSGKFLIRAPRAGSFRLRASHFGYATFTTDVFPLSGNTEAVADIRLAPAPVAIDTLEASGERRVPQLARAGFYTRRDGGFGYYLARDEIVRRSAHRVTDLLHGYPGAAVVSVGSMGQFDVMMRGASTMLFRSGRREAGAPARAGCFPTVAVDGVIVRNGGVGVEVGRWNELVHPSEVEAIEVHPAAAGLPVQLRGNVSPCGAIVIWTVRGR